jgi:hypothetical protein
VLVTTACVIVAKSIGRRAPAEAEPATVPSTTAPAAG